MYELFEHTADLGLRVRAADLDTLFAEAAACLFTAAVEDLQTVRPTHAVSIEIEADDLAFLLFDWLRALLMRYDADAMLFSAFEVKIDGNHLKAIARGEPTDLGRHSLTHEVKAITYHELKVEPCDGGWLAEVIVDI